MRLLTEDHIEDIALGAAILGTGGGGDPYIGKVMTMAAIKQYGPIELYDLDELDDDDLIIPAAGMGAPAVLIEKLPAGNDMIRAFEALGKYLGKKPKATMSIEAGGLNSVMPMYVASRLRLPMVDCDGMGRAFPELQMTLFTAQGITATPFAMSDERGNVLLMNTITNKWTETFARSIVVNMGAMSMVALYSATIKQLKKAAIPGTITLAETIGKAIRKARLEEANPVEALCQSVGAFLLFKGKLSDVNRKIQGGWNLGEAKLEGIDDFAGRSILIHFQNENLGVSEDGEFIITTPDLISVVDVDTAEPITTEHLRYGMRVAVIGLPCHPAWRESEALKLVHPRYFGYEIEYVSVEERFKIQD
jgi:uncharacterized protein